MKNELILGDCLELMKDIPDDSIDLILCDPPFGTTASKWDKILDYDKMWEQYERIIKDRGAILLFCSQPFTSMLGASNPKMLKYSWVWNKRKAGNFAQGNRQPMKVHEDVLVFYKKQPTYNPQKIQLEKPNKRHLGKKSKNRSDRKEAGGIGGEIKYSKNYEPDKKLPISIVEFKKDNYRGNVFHPTQKPVALCEYLIRTYTNEGDLVLDNCMGSGTTIMAAINEGRDYIGMEKEEKYFEVAKERIKKCLEAKSNQAS